jgi:hypothetical protein
MEFHQTDTLRMFLRCSTEISPLENFLLAYVDSVD